MRWTRRQIIHQVQVVVCLSFVFSLLPLATTLAEPDSLSGSLQTKWERADKAVAEGVANPARSWLWGPQSFTPPNGATEPYAESPNGSRQVLYFDKARMEINNPLTGIVTNGLLVRELISGRLATGDAGFIQRRVADDIPVAGDPTNNVGPTYASFNKVATLDNDNGATPRIGLAVNTTIDQTGTTGTSTELGSKTKYVYYDASLKHNIPDVFWFFLNQRGTIYDGKQYVQNQPVLGENMLAPWIEMVGLPITEAYWAKVTVAGQTKDVLIQAFERRVLTYTPANPAAFQVEMGNVGRHYYTWRYDNKYNLPVAGLKPATYTGVNLSGAEFGETALPGTYGTDYTYPTHAEIDYFISKGMNIFRLPFRWERLQPLQYADLEATELARLDDFVNYATSKKITVLLDPHNYAHYFGKTVGVAEAPAPAFADFWSKLANHYKANTLVGFGLMNEPTKIPLSLWIEDANAAIKAIRATGATNLITVPGSSETSSYSWNQKWYGTNYGTQMLTIKDPANNYAFEFHQYLDADSSGTSDICVSPTVGSERLKDFTAWLKQNNQRGFLGEFGGGRNENCYNALDDMLNYLDHNTDVWLGWTYWSAGPLWKSYIYTLEPVGTDDRPQLAPLSKHLYNVILKPTPTSVPNPSSTPTVGPTVTTTTPVPANVTSTVPAQTTTPVPASTPNKFGVQYSVPSHWETGYGVSVTIVNNNTNEVNGWKISWQLAYGETLSNFWNANCSLAGNTLTCTNMPYNATLGANGGGQNFGAMFTTKGGAVTQPKSFTVNDIQVNN